jgi:hypothetical protein
MCIRHLPNGLHDTPVTKEHRRGVQDRVAFVSTFYFKGVWFMESYFQTVEHTIATRSALTYTVTQPAQNDPTLELSSADGLGSYRVFIGSFQLDFLGGYNILFACPLKRIIPRPFLLS